MSEKIARIAFMHIFAVGESSPRVCHCLYASPLYGVVHTSLICIIFVAIGNWLHIDCLVRVTCTAPRGGACSRIKVYLCTVESPILLGYLLNWVCASLLWVVRISFVPLCRGYNRLIG